MPGVPFVISYFIFFCCRDPGSFLAHEKVGKVSNLMAWNLLSPLGSRPFCAFQTCGAEASTLGCQWWCSGCLLGAGGGDHLRHQERAFDALIGHGYLMLSSRKKETQIVLEESWCHPFCRKSLFLKMDNSLWPIIDVVGPAETGMKFQKQEHLRSPRTLSHPWCDCRPPHPHPSPSPPHSPHPSSSSPHHLRIFMIYLSLSKEASEQGCCKCPPVEAFASLSASLAWGLGGPRGKGQLCWWRFPVIDRRFSND